MSEQNVSRGAELRYSLALHKQALTWFHFLPTDPILRLSGSFLVFSFCMTKGHRGPVPRHLEPKCPRASGDFSGAQLFAPELSRGEMETEVTLQQPPPPSYIRGAASVGGGAGGSADLLRTSQCPQQCQDVAVSLIP